MRNQNLSVIRGCFLVLLGVGVFLLMTGTILEPISPHFALDRVLTPAELHDPDKMASTLALLQKAQGNRWLLWTLTGIVVLFISGLGLWVTFRKDISSNSN